ncbi:MAG: chitobiase/beta-hexosaminidase C-terminal domain-containing protein, partial [Bacteroidota bacterium]
ASDKAPTALDGGLHTNFILDKEGEYLGLVRPDLTVEHAYQIYPKQRNYHSYGLIPGTQDEPDVVANQRILRTPSPGAANSEALDVPLDFSVESHYFFNSFLLSLSSPVPGAEIRYTTDESEPGAFSTLYSSPIAISAKTIFKARLIYSDGSQSPVITHRYYRLNTNLQAVDSDLPILIIDTDGSGLNANNQTPSFSSLIEPDPQSGRTNLALA